MNTSRCRVDRELAGRNILGSTDKKRRCTVRCARSSARLHCFSITLVLRLHPPLFSRSKRRSTRHLQQPDTLQPRDDADALDAMPRGNNHQRAAQQKQAARCTADHDANVRRGRRQQSRGAAIDVPR